MFFRFIIFFKTIFFKLNLNFVSVAHGFRKILFWKEIKKKLFRNESNKNQKNVERNLFFILDLKLNFPDTF